MFNPNRYLKSNSNNNYNTINQQKVFQSSKSSLSKGSDISEKDQCLRLIQINPYQSPKNQASSEQPVLTEISSVKYVPKRFAKLQNYSMETPLKYVGKSTLDCQALFGSKTNIMKNKKSEQNKEKEDINKNILNVNCMSFRNEYIIKFSNNGEYFNKFEKFVEFISNDKQSAYSEIFVKMKKLLRSQTHLFFEGNCEEKTELPRINITADSDQNYYQSHKNLEKSSNSSQLLNNKKIIVQWYEMISLTNKFLSIILGDLREYRTLNKRLNQKITDYEMRLASDIKEIDKMKKFLNKYEVSSKIFLKLKNEKELSKIKTSFNQKENKYILSIYKLEEEIKTLTNLLDHNQKYYNECKDLQKEVEIGKKKNEELKLLFNQGIREKNVQNARDREAENDLLQQMEKLNEVIEELKKEANVSRKNDIENQVKIKKLNMNLDERSENIMMLNEEMEWYMKELNKEKNNSKIMKIELNHLENIILNGIKEKEQEKKDEGKEEVIQKENNDKENNGENTNAENNKEKIESTNRGEKQENEAIENISKNDNFNNNYSLDNDKDKENISVPVLNLSLINSNSP
jgi:hypothetical protein